ncbi:MAG: hypothetical protein ACQEV7_10345 [Bacillota bacterium]
MFKTQVIITEKALTLALRRNQDPTDFSKVIHLYMILQEHFKDKIIEAIPIKKGVKLYLDYPLPNEVKVSILSHHEVINGLVRSPIDRPFINYDYTPPRSTPEYFYHHKTKKHIFLCPEKSYKIVLRKPEPISLLRKKSVITQVDAAMTYLTNGAYPTLDDHCF